MSLQEPRSTRGASILGALVVVGLPFGHRFDPWNTGQMSVVRRHLQTHFLRSLTFLVSVGALLLRARSMTLLEEDDGGFGDFDSPTLTTLPTSHLTDSEMAFLRDVDERILGYNKRAAQRIRRHQFTAIGSIVLAASVPVAVAGDAPRWSIAALGSLAVVLQGAQQILQDHRIGVESHAVSTYLSIAKRRFLFSASNLKDDKLRKLAIQFVLDVDELESSAGTRILEALRERNGPHSV